MKIDYFTTTEVAAIMRVSQHTIQKWFDEGRLTGYKMPSGTRKITTESVVAYMEEFNMPTDILEEYESEGSDADSR